MERTVSYIFAFLLVFLFILQGQSDDHYRILLALVFSVLISVSAFLIHWISLNAIFAGTVFGTFTLGFGGWVTGVLVLIFFVSSSLLTRRPALNRMEGEIRGSEASPGTPSGNFDALSPADRERRNELQIWANGFWIVVCTILWFLLHSWEIMVMTAAAIATVTADTWATELGSREPEGTVLITSLRPVPPGTDGGVSLQGTIGGLCGALLIAVCFTLFTREFSLAWFSIILFSGFMGCLADSCIGAIYQTRLTGRSIKNMGQSSEWENSVTNWYSSGIGVLIAFILIQFI